MTQGNNHKSMYNSAALKTVKVSVSRVIQENEMIVLSNSLDHFYVNGQTIKSMYNSAALKIAIPFCMKCEAKEYEVITIH